MGPLNCQAHEDSVAERLIKIHIWVLAALMEAPVVVVKHPSSKYREKNHLQPESTVLHHREVRAPP